VVERITHLDGANAVTSRSVKTHTYQHDDARWLLGQLTKTTTAQENLRSLPTTTATQTALAVQVTPTAVSVTRTTPGSLTQAITASVSGGVGTFSFTWTRVNGTRTTISNANQANAVVSASLGWGETINETLRITVRDSSGATVTRDVPVRFAVLNQATAPLSIQMNPTSLAASLAAPGVASAAVTVSGTDGVAPYSYAWTRLNGNRIGISNAAAANPTFTATLGWAESLSETYQLRVTDAAGTTITQNLPITFTSPAPLAASLSPAGNVSGVCNQYIQKSISTSGGVAPYSYTWSTTGGVAVQSNAAASTYVFAPAGQYGGSGGVSVVVRDSAGNQLSVGFYASFFDCSGA
jgi:hypothetical protein